MLAYERHGSGEPLVLIHGFGHRRQAWYPLLDRLVDQREVILVDMPGHGESHDLVLNGADPADALREEFADFFDEQGLDRPHLAGNSLGAMLALDLASNGRARSVTGLSPAGFWRNSAEFAYTKAVFKVVTTGSKLMAPRAAELAKTAAGRFVLFGWLVAHPERLSMELALGDVKAFTRARPAMAAILGAEGVAQKRAKTPDVPVTIGWATRDTVLPPIQAAQAKKLLPNATHEWLHSCGHSPMSDSPEMVADLLLRGSAN